MKGIPGLDVVVQKFIFVGAKIGVHDLDKNLHFSALENQMELIYVDPGRLIDFFSDLLDLYNIIVYNENILPWRPVRNWETGWFRRGSII